MSQALADLAVMELLHRKHHFVLDFSPGEEAGQKLYLSPPGLFLSLTVNRGIHCMVWQ